MMSVSHPRLQSISDGKVVNHTTFGIQLQDVAFRLLTKWLEKVDYGFQDGGCLMFARALQAWSDGQLSLSAVYRPNSPLAQHVLATSESGLFLDSDGLGTKYDVHFKAAAFEFIYHSSIKAFSMEAVGDIPNHPELVDFIADHLAAELGPYHSEILKLDTASLPRLTT